MTKIPYLSLLVQIILSGLLVSCIQATTLPTLTSEILPTSTFELIMPSGTSPLPFKNATATSIASSTQQVFAMTLTPTALEPILQLTFTSDRLGEYGLFSIEVGCLDAETLCLSEPELLFSWENRISAVDWSPDGLKLVFESDGDLFLADWNGENITRLPIAPGSEAWPQWSPDGTKIAYIYAAAREGSEALDQYQIQIYDFLEDKTTSIFNAVYDPSRIYWLSEKEIAYISKSSKTDWTEFISIVEIDGTIVQQLPKNATDYTHILGLDFSPDSNQLVFVGDISPQVGKSSTDIYIIDRAEGIGMNITNGVGINLDPVWSPSANWIAFESNRTGDYDIYLIKPDGSQLIQITQTSSRDNNPAWRIIP